MEQLIVLLKEGAKEKNPRITVRDITKFRKELHDFFKSNPHEYAESDNSEEGLKIKYAGTTFPVTESPDQVEHFLIHY